MIDAAILSGVKKYLGRLSDAGLPISFGVVFGSYVQGNATALSDIDLIVVSPKFDGEISRKSIDQLWQAAARVDSRIEPIPCGQKQWQNDTTSAIIEIARNHGQQVRLTA